MQRGNIVLTLAATLAASGVGCEQAQDLLSAFGQEDGSGYGQGGGGNQPTPPPPPPRSCGPSIGVDNLYGAVARDLAGIDAEDQPFQRYVTLANRFNAGECDLDAARAAVAELFNGTSTNPRITRPVAIDAASLIFRVDLRDYDWDRELEVDDEEFADGWEAVLARTPFAVEYAGPDADETKARAGTAVPLLNFDALADAASEGSLYYALVEVPGSSDALFESLGIDVEQNRADGAAVLAGTSRSRVSRADRIAERHDLEVRAGFLWRTFDFDVDQDASIFAEPLSVESDGNVTLFSLPNGLLGFAIFDADGARLDDSDLLLDASQNNFRTKVAGSCLNCHGAVGVLPLQDEVREVVRVNADQLEPEVVAGALRLYPPQDELDRIIASDSAAYGAALRGAGVISAGPDPLRSELLAFDGDLQLPQMVGDLWLSERAIAESFDELPPIFSQGLAARDEYAAFYAEAACTAAEGENRPAGCD
jgi:hypothetical protein